MTAPGALHPPNGEADVTPCYDYCSLRTVTSTASGRMQDFLIRTAKNNVADLLFNEAREQMRARPEPPAPRRRQIDSRAEPTGDTGKDGPSSVGATVHCTALPGLVFGCRSAEALSVRDRLPTHPRHVPVRTRFHPSHRLEEQAAILRDARLAPSFAAARRYPREGSLNRTASFRSGRPHPIDPRKKDAWDVQDETALISHRGRSWLG